MANSKALLSFVLLAVSVSVGVSAQRTYLRADGNSDGTYDLINNVLGGVAYEVPDCPGGHPGAHITQHVDTTLNIPVFNFRSHIDYDSDRCIIFDRVRTEIKTHNPSAPHLKCFQGESVSYSWDFRLHSELQPSTAFTHVFQIKAVDGESSQPLITITPRLKSSGAKTLQVIWSGVDSVPVTVFEEELAKYLGKWIHVIVELTCKAGGLFHMRMKRTDNGEQLMNYNSASMDLWRAGNSYLRPKWGVYRSLNDRGSLRDENVYFNNFCIAKGSPLCA